MFIFECCVKVHALNILRALYKDTRLGEDVAPYISEGLKAAILGFKSQFWEVITRSFLFPMHFLCNVYIYMTLHEKTRYSDNF